MNYEQILFSCKQEHIWEHYLTLSEKEREAFQKQLEQVDWTAFLSGTEQTATPGEISPIGGCSVREIGERKDEFFRSGKEAIAKGKLACVVLAGGMGTRLGSSAPKGTFDIGLTRPLYIFGQQVNNLSDACRSCGCYVPLCVMTSAANDEETRAFWREHGYFGYPQEYIRFFVQDMAPCTDFGGKILLEERGKLALSPNGNGGWFSSLVRSGLLNDGLLKDVEWFNVYAVDNVLQRMADPVFLGATILSGKKCGAKVVRKSCPEERVGVLCLRGGVPDVVEYYEIDEKTAALKDEKGELLYPYGVILNYLFGRKELDGMLSKAMPVHKAKKCVPYMGADGKKVSPERENAYKYETLILDMVRFAGSCLPFEVEREREFAPVKNRTGVDSVESARELLKHNGVEL